MAAEKTTLEEIEKNFAELSPAMIPSEAFAEANRCLFCFDAPCTAACPTHIDVARFIKQIASRNLRGSARTILEANPMGHSCARVCPVEVLCEGACVHNLDHKKPIEIARLQRFATDSVYLSGEVKNLFSPGPPTGKKVAVLGAGPAGLACAVYLRRLGHEVDIYEKRKLPGGLNTFGIAEYKMDQKTALAETELASALGAKILCGKEVGKDLKFSELEKKYDAIFLGVGLGPTQKLGIPGEELPGSVDALAFIEKVKSRRWDQIKIGRTVCVVGLGNTAVDCATQAKRLGAEKVIMVYRRSRAEVPCYDYEFEIAKSDAVEFVWRAAPVAIVGNGRVEGLKCVATRLGAPDEKGRRKPEPQPGTEFVIPCEMVIRALGQTPLSEALARWKGLSLDEKGRVRIDPKTCKTSHPKVWAGGDCANGGKEVVNAAEDGKRAAWNIHCALTGEKTAAPEHAYWVSTIDNQRPAPPPPALIHTHA